jgi:putative glutamine amidotransferase
MRTPPCPVLVGVTACLKEQASGACAHVVMPKYVDAVVAAVEAVPVILPAIGRRQDVAALLGRLDGVLVTGSPSNVDPACYGGAPAREGNICDPERDATTLPLIRSAIASGVPLLAICRGIQELNVALGGTLHQHVHEVPGRHDHRSDKTVPPAERYAPRHPVAVTPGGLLARILGGAPSIPVNSLHGQGIDRLAPGLAVEAAAEDGTIEAVTLPGAAGFVLGVQWHPEYSPLDDPWSRRLFQAFAAAVRASAAARGGSWRTGTGGLGSTGSPRSSASSPTSTASPAARSSRPTSSCAR